MISSRITEAMTLPAILLNISPTPIGLRPGFLSRGIKRQARKASKEEDRFSSTHKLLITSPNALHRSEEGLLKLFDVNILLHPSASIPEGPEPPLVLIAAIRTSSASMLSNLTG